MEKSLNNCKMEDSCAENDNVAIFEVLSASCNSCDRTGELLENVVRKCDAARALTEDDVSKLNLQDARGLISLFHQQKLEREAAVNWDKFYKRNETRFFKDRHWTIREFEELVGKSDEKRILFEVGCGVGNFFFPLLEEEQNLFIYACDLSPRAIQFIKQHPLYNEDKVNAFVHDIAKENVHDQVGGVLNVDFISLVFVLSAIHPDKHRDVLQRLYKCLAPGGVVLFRDYAINDMAMIRFKPGSKLMERFYVRQDGTRAYYFTKFEITALFISCGFSVIDASYVYRKTVNIKEGVDAPRVFLQGKFTKLSVNDGLCLK